MICFMAAFVLTALLIYSRLRWDGSVLEHEVFLFGAVVVCLYVLWGILELYGYRFLRIPGIICSLFQFGMMGFLECFPSFGVERARGDEHLMLVLGAPVVDGRSTPCLVSRGECAAHWLQTHPDTTAVLSGGRNGGRTEARALSEIITRQGVSAHRLLLEEHSTTTDENFRFSRPILEEKGWNGEEPLVVVTNRFHVFRLRNYAAKWGCTNVRYLVTPTPLPVRFIWAFREVILVCRWWVLGS